MLTTRFFYESHLYAKLGQLNSSSLRVVRNIFPSQRLVSSCTKNTDVRDWKPEEDLFRLIVLQCFQFDFSLMRIMEQFNFNHIHNCTSKKITPFKVAVGKCDKRTISRPISLLQNTRQTPLMDFKPFPFSRKSLGSFKMRVQRYQNIKFLENNMAFLATNLSSFYLSLPYV